MGNKESNKLIRNIFSLSLGQGLNLLINFFSIILAARFLGVENFGIFNYYLAIVNILSRVNDLGINIILFREFSKDNKNFDLLIKGLNLKLIVFACILFFSFLLPKLFGSSNKEIFILSIMLLGIIISYKFQNFRDLLEIPLKVSYNMHYSMIFALIDNLVLLICVILIPYYNFGLLYFVFIYTFSNLPGFIFTVLILKRKFNFSFHFKFNYNYKWIITETRPLWAFAFLIMLYQQNDLIILKYIDGSYSAGIYSSALKLIMPFNIIYYALITTIYPKITNFFYDDYKNAVFYSKIVLKILFFISFSLMLIISFKSEEILAIFFGMNYIEAKYSIILICLNQIFFFFNSFCADVLMINMHSQKYNFYYSLLVVITSLIFLFFLIPKYSYNGAGLGRLLATMAGSLFFLFILFMKKFDFNILNIRILIWISLTIIISFLFSNFNLFVYILTLPLFIAISGLIIKFFTNEEIILLLKIFNKENWLKKIKILKD